MTATWRTKVAFELSQNEAERLYDLIYALVNRDPQHSPLTDDEREYIAAFLRLLRNPADTQTNLIDKYAEALMPAPWHPERMPF